LELAWICWPEKRDAVFRLKLLPGVEPVIVRFDPFDTSGDPKPE
jgi:hypothetical protein